MKLKEAKEILAKNFLDLEISGLDFIPNLKIIEIEEFEIINQSKDDPNKDTAWFEKAYLLGIIDEQKKGNPYPLREYVPEGDFYCCSFIVKIWHKHYYREFFREAMEVIEALRIANEYNYKESDDKDKIFITL